MHDIRWIRENPEAFDIAMTARNSCKCSEKILSLDTQKRKIMTDLQQAQAQKNELSANIGISKRKGEDSAALEAEVLKINSSIDSLTKEQARLSNELNAILISLPNIPLKDVPEGKDESFNQCVRVVGTPPIFDFKPKAHYDLGEDLGFIDFKAASKISGSRFTILKSQIAALERALKNFMIDNHTREFGYTEVSVPFLVKEESMYGTGQLPKFAQDSFVTTDGRWLIPTAEVPLTNLVSQSILSADTLPLRFTAYSACFRSEAGAAGRDTRGMIRNHQFSKVEMVSIVLPEDGEKELERMTEAAESILKKLGLAYRVVLLSTGDMGFSAQKTYDLEVYIPSESTYREISSCSLCGTFQARRMDARYKNGDQKGFVATLNGSGLAIGRTIVAILENYQLSNGNVEIPEVLVPYMNGRKEIKADE